MRLCVEYVGEHVHYPGPATACSYIVSSNYQLPTFYAGGGEGGVLRLPTAPPAAAILNSIVSPPPSSPSQPVVQMLPHTG